MSVKQFWAKPISTSCVFATCEMRENVAIVLKHSNNEMYANSLNHHVVQKWILRYIRGAILQRFNFILNEVSSIKSQYTLIKKYMTFKCLNKYFTREIVVWWKYPSTLYVPHHHKRGEKQRQWQNIYFKKEQREGSHIVMNKLKNGE